MLLLIVFILAYGVAIQAIIDPYREFSLETIGKVLFSIVFMPYWQMYGELSLEDIAVQPDSTGCWNREPFNVSSTDSFDDYVSSLKLNYCSWKPHPFICMRKFFNKKVGNRKN